MGHIHERYDFTTSAFIVHDEKVLLLHHKKIGMWLQPGGHVELGEDLLEAVYREVEEETGLTQDQLTIVETAKDRRKTSDHAKILPLPFDINVHPFNETHDHIDLAYIMRSSTDTVRLEAEKAHGIGWFRLTAIEELAERDLTYPDIVDLSRIALKYA